jgi:nicotinamide-nucleotide amidase
MRSSLLVTGSELLSGHQDDVLMQPFAIMLAAKGIHIQETRFIHDRPDILSSAIVEFVGKVDMIVVTGGLGDTPDDTTYIAINTLKEKLGLKEVLEKRIENPVGYAKGIDIEIRGTRIVFLPGVPAEALTMMKIILGPIPDHVSEKVDIPIFGLRENEVVQHIGVLANQCSFLPKDMEVKVIAPRKLEKEIREKLGKYVLEAEDLSSSFGLILSQRGLTVACAESCTGGLAGHLITQVPGSSEYFKGSIVAYSNEIKEKLLNVSSLALKKHGAVSEQVAGAMLEGVLKMTGADVGIATTGIAGPSGGSEEKPVGTVWIAVGTMNDHTQRVFQFSFDRQRNKLITAKVALFLLRMYIYDKDIHRSSNK